MPSDEDREERRFLTMKGEEDSASGPPRGTCFAESSGTQPTVGDTEKEKATKSMYNRSQRGQEENKRKCKRRKRVVESLHKPGINYTHFSCSIQP